MDITEHKRLEKEVLQISEMEQRRIDQDLHDGICRRSVGTNHKMQTGSRSGRHHFARQKWLELIKDIQAFSPTTPVLVISMHDETLYAERILRAGGRGCADGGNLVGINFVKFLFGARRGVFSVLSLSAIRFQNTKHA